MPIPAALIPILLQAGIGGAQAIGGAIGRGKKRPDYDIPESAQEALTLAKLNAGTNMPGYDRMAANIALGQSNSLAAARESGNVMESVGAISGSTNAANRNLDVANSQSMKQDDLNLQQMLSRYSQLEDQQFQMNEFAPYADTRAESTQAIGAGLSNLVGATDNYGAYSQINDLFKPNSGSVSPANSYKARASSSTALNPMILSLLPQLLKLGK